MSWQAVVLTPQAKGKWEANHEESCSCPKCGHDFEAGEEPVRQVSRGTVRRYLCKSCYDNLYY